MVSVAVALVLPIAVALAWNFLDAAPTLFFYDKVVTLTGMDPSASLSGKTIWITGASSGIGASLVCQVMQAGAGHGKYTIPGLLVRLIGDCTVFVIVSLQPILLIFLAFSPP
jgi:NADPH:quinone reductase-like Zn-dependent oxidoreductase